MHPLLLLLNMDAPEAIVVTGSRERVSQLESPVAVHSVEGDGLDSIALPHAPDALRLLPGLSVATTGPRGTQTQIRIRGGEANHTLLFVDGIRFNDPAAGNEARFELLSTDFVERIELLPGPQSALWGSEALAGIISVDTADPFRREGAAALAEYGSQDSIRASARAAVLIGDLGLSASASYLAGDGIDSFGRGGERDGFDARSFGLRAAWRPAREVEFGVTGLYFAGTSEYDGLDPLSFRRADTLDESANRIAAIRGWGRASSGGWTLSADSSLLDSSNRNRLGQAPLNRTAGRRTTSGAQLSRRLGGHRLTAAVEHENEEFRARDQVHFGGTDQDRGRSLTAWVGEWHARWSRAVTTDLAVRHDSFSAFADSTTLRAAAMARPGGGWTLHLSYGEGIAQPTFYDLYGFFPGSFAGNPALRPESGRGWEAGAHWRRGRAAVGATAFTSRLANEIVDVAVPGTFLFTTRNAEATSRRRGLELTGEYRVSGALRFSLNYTFLDARERREPTDSVVRETRRPRHSGNLVGFGESGRLQWSGTVALVGARDDLDFDIFPARRVRLGSYVLASLRLGWRLTDHVEAYLRMENAFDADYQDVVGYNSSGRTIHAGLRLRLGD